MSIGHLIDFIYYVTNCNKNIKIGNVMRENDVYSFSPFSYEHIFCHIYFAQCSVLKVRIETEYLK